LEGRKILRWAKTADNEDNLYFAAAYPSDTSNFAQLYYCNIGSAAPLNVNVTISSAGSYAHLNSEYVILVLSPVLTIFKI
jgi:hypothetical protein